MGAAETLGQSSSDFGQARPGFAVEEMSIAQTDAVSMLLNLPGNVFHSSPGRGQVRETQLSLLPSLNNHISKLVLCLSGWDKDASDQRIPNITGFFSFLKKNAFLVFLHVFTPRIEKQMAQGCSCLVLLRCPLAGRRARRPPKRFEITVEVSGVLMRVKWKATSRSWHGGTSRGPGGFMPSSGDADPTTPAVSPDCSRDKETIKDTTVNQPLINYNRIRSLKGYGNRSELSNSNRKIAVCSWWAWNVSVSKMSVMSLSQNFSKHTIFFL